MLILTERVRDVLGPSVSSSKLYCRECGCEVWVDLTLVDQVPNVQLVCRPCLKVELDERERTAHAR